LLSEDLWCYAVFVWAVGVGTVEKEKGDNLSVAISGSKVERS